MRKLFQIQIYLNFLMAVTILITSNTIKAWLYLVILSVVILVKRNRRISHVINIIFLPTIFIDQLVIVANLLIHNFSNLTIIFFWLYFVGAIVTLIPITKVEYGKIKKPIFRLLASIWITTFTFTSFSLSLKNISQDGFLVGLNKSEMVYALTMLIYVYFVLESWGYKLYFNLPTFKKKKWQFILVFGITIWLIFFKVFSGIAQDWQEAVWKWNFSLINPIDSIYLKNVWCVYFYSLEAGIGEEAIRYIDLVLLLIIFKNQKWRIGGAVIGSAILFALPHIKNVFSSELRLSPMETAGQIIDTFGFGCFAAILILYSGKLWITMIIHTLYDFLIFSETPLADPSTTFFFDGNGHVMNIIIRVGGWLILWSMFSILLLIRNKKLIKHNVQILTKKQILI